MSKPKPDVEERAKALEDEFFRRQDERALEKLRARKQRAAALDEIREVSGISDEAVLASLVDAGVEAATFPAITLVPLAAVAWANGEVEEPEREAVLQAAREAGVGPTSPAHGFLSRMLEDPLDPGMLPAWEAYAEALAASLPETQRRVMLLGLASWARRVAEAAGGILGLGAVSAAEESVLKRIAAPFE